MDVSNHWNDASTALVVTGTSQNIGWKVTQSFWPSSGQHNDMIKPFEKFPHCFFIINPTRMSTLSGSNKLHTALNLAPNNVSDLAQSCYHVALSQQWLCPITQLSSQHVHRGAFAHESRDAFVWKFSSTPYVWKFSNTRTQMPKTKLTRTSCECTPRW